MNMSWGEITGAPLRGREKQWTVRMSGKGKERDRKVVAPRLTSHVSTSRVRQKNKTYNNCDCTLFICFPFCFLSVYTFSFFFTTPRNSLVFPFYFLLYLHTFISFVRHLYNFQGKNTFYKFSLFFLSCKKFELMVWFSKPKFILFNVENLNLCNMILCVSYFMCKLVTYKWEYIFYNLELH